jgi:hypothetical protein
VYGQKERLSVKIFPEDCPLRLRLGKNLLPHRSISIYGRRGVEELTYCSQRFLLKGDVLCAVWVFSNQFFALPSKEETTAAHRVSHTIGRAIPSSSRWGTRTRAATALSLHTRDDW